MLRNKNLSIILISALFLNFILLKPGVFFGYSAALNSTASLEHQTNQTLVKVVLPIKVFHTVLVSQSYALEKTATSCLGAATNSSNFTQDTGLINLNQPASCFSLTQGTQQAYNFVGVRHLVEQNTKIVVVSTSQITAGFTLPNPIQTMPMAPAVAIVISAAMAIVYRKFVSESKILKENLLHYNLSSAQLQVFRC